MSTIRNTVHTTLQAEGNGGYTRYAEGVIVALEDRERQMADHLAEFAMSKGLSEHETWTALTNAGLPDTRPAPEPEVEASEPGDLRAILDALADLKTQVGALRSAAARHGVTV